MSKWNIVYSKEKLRIFFQYASTEHDKMQYDMKNYSSKLCQWERAENLLIQKYDFSDYFSVGIIFVNLPIVHVQCKEYILIL